MRLIIQFNAKKDLIIPINYNEIIQGFIYRHLNETLAQRIHDRGFTFEKRSFKLFTFSRILGKIKVEKNSFKISPPFNLIISSPYHELLQSLAENLLLRPEVNLAQNPLYIESVTVKVAPPMGDTVVINMLSPITIYSTLTSPDGKKKTYYYHPREKEFSELVTKNLLKKYVAFYRNQPKCQDFRIEPININKKDEKIVFYKGFVIKGWMGKFRLSGSEELLRFAYDAGLGAKNSQGFGCFEVESFEEKR